MFDRDVQVFDNGGVNSSLAWNESSLVHEVHPVLRTVLPNGLRPEVYSVNGATSVAFGMLVSGWCGIVGLPELGLEAASQWGVNLDRLVIAPSAGSWLETVAALIEGLDVVLAEAPGDISPHTAQRLVARLRAHRTTLIVLGDWPRAHARITARTVGWSGLGQGHGFLTGQRMEILVTTRSGERTTTIIRDENGLTALS